MDIMFAGSWTRQKGQTRDIFPTHLVMLHMGGLDEMSHWVGIPMSDTTPRGSMVQINQLCLPLEHRGAEVLQRQEMG